MGWCPKFRDLWPIPPFGLDAIADSSKPPPYHDSPATHQTIPRNPRGPEFQGAYAQQNYATGMNRYMNRSLARQMLYTWDDAAYNTGGPHYPNDYGFGPGFHGDCMTPQFYMRPGYKVPVQAGGRQI